MIVEACEGVDDGAFWLPPDGGGEAVVRLVALVVAPGLDRQAVLAALRERVDAAFLPRRILKVDSLPRDPTGKLPSGRLAELERVTAPSMNRTVNCLADVFDFRASDTAKRTAAASLYDRDTSMNRNTTVAGAHFGWGGAASTPRRASGPTCSRPARQ